MQHIPLKLSHSMAWFLREKISPGQFLHPSMSETYHITEVLRRKVNEAILYFAANEEATEYRIEVSPEEAWCIDLWIRFDGPGNEGTTVLYQLFKGLAGKEGVEMPPLKKVDLSDINDMLGMLDS